MIVLRSLHLLTLASALDLLIVSAAAGNILTNGELDRWADGRPVGWEVGDGVAIAQDVNMRVSGTAAARLHPERKHPDVHPNSLIAQQVELEPGATYRLTFWSAKDATGDVRAYVSAKDGSGLVLEYVSGWANFYPWTEVSATFQTSAATGYTLRLVHYGHVAAKVWFDHVVLERIDTQDPVAESPDGVELFTQSYMVPFNAETLDRTAQLTDRIGVQITRGEYEPCLVGIRAHRDLDAVDLRLTGDLRSRQGHLISSDFVTIRSCDEGILPLSRPRSVTTGRNLGWWVTIQADKKLPPGPYAGSLQVVSGDKVIAETELVVDVLDLALPPPEISFFMYHAEYYFLPEHITPALNRAYYDDMVEHGMTTVTIYISPNVDGERIDFSKNYIILPSKHPELAEWGYDQAVPALLESGLCAGGQPPILLFNKQEGPGSEDAFSETILRGMLDTWSSRAWPQPLLYLFDEPSTQERIDQALPVLKKIKAWGLPVRTTTAGLDMPALGSLYDVWIQAESEINRETFDQAREHGAEIWTYNCTVPYVNAAFDRALYGFWAYRSGVRGVGRWAYHDNRKGYIDDEGVRQGPVGGRLSHIIPSSRGPVPTVAWEAVREGVDDYRLMTLFDTTVEEAAARLEELQSRYRALLSEADIDLLTQLDQRRRTKYKPDETPIAWKPASSQQSNGERAFTAARALAGALEIAHLAKKNIVESIPADAMGIRDAVPFASMSETLVPTLGLGDQRTVAEVKRRAMIGYLLRVKAALEAANEKE